MNNSILGYDLRLGPEVPQPKPFAPGDLRDELAADGGRQRSQAQAIRDGRAAVEALERWLADIGQAIRDHDGWGVLFQRPDLSVHLASVRAADLIGQARHGGRAWVLCAREAPDDGLTDVRWCGRVPIVGQALSAVSVLLALTLGCCGPGRPSNEVPSLPTQVPTEATQVTPPPVEQTATRPPPLDEGGCCIESPITPNAPPNGAGGGPENGS